MPKFEDKENRTWVITLDVGLIEDIKDETEIDLDELIRQPQKMSEMIFVSPRKMVELLYVCCEKQIALIPLTPREFARIFDRDVLDKACNALLEAIMLFYPRSSVGNVIQKNLPKMIEEMDRKLVVDTEAKVKQVLSDIATVSPV